MPFLGAACHGFQTMLELRQSLTEAWGQRRLLTAEEQIAMALNFEPFLCPGFDERPAPRHGLFYAQTQVQFQTSGVVSEAADQRWTRYANNPDARREEKKVGAMKRRVNLRGELDRNEIFLTRLEVKGAQRLRRRILLPDNFAAITNIVPPDPTVMIVQSIRFPFHPKAGRAEAALLAEEEAAAQRELHGVQDHPFPSGPEQPPGLLDDLPPVAEGGVGRGRGRGGRGRGRGGRGRGRGGRGRGRGNNVGGDGDADADADAAGRGLGRGGRGGRGRGGDDGGGGGAGAGAGAAAAAGLGRGRGRGRGHGQGQGQAQPLLIDAVGVMDARIFRWGRDG